MPWKNDMVGWPYSCSTPTPCAFIATSIPPLHRPKATRAANSIAIDGASARSGSVTHKPSPAAIMTTRLLKRAMSRPVMENATSAPMPMHSKARPSWLSFNARFSLMEGMRAAHVAKTAPLTKNAAATARRAAVMRNDMVRDLKGIAEKISLSLDEENPAGTVGVRGRNDAFRRSAFRRNAFRRSPFRRTCRSSSPPRYVPSRW